ncbi:MAG: penicillin-binding protein 2 [Chlamydiia bacterium]|nr:penicillin-binding protein 2 [Chlamydiia bacterium]
MRHKEKKKIIAIALLMFSLFSLLVVKYFKIQVVEWAHWQAIANNQQTLVIKEPFRRGSFYSNVSLKKGHPEKEQPFVIDVTKFHLFIDPLSLPETIQQEVAARLAELSGIEEKAQFFSHFSKKSRCRKVASWLSRETKQQIENWWYPYARNNNIPSNAIFFRADYHRSYPFGSLLGQVLHTIREAKEETTRQALPTGGLEAYFNSLLQGREGKRRIVRSPRNSLATDEQIEPPENGADIFLTINHYIQAIAEEELEKGVIAAEAKGGWVVMMDPYSGEILALAQYPPFDPSRYKEYFNDPIKVEHAQLKPVTNAYELGSIMKPITLAICLKGNQELVSKGEAPLFHPEEKIPTIQEIFPGRASKPLRDVSRSDYLNMYMAIQKSSNIYMATLIDRLINYLGSNWYRETLEDTFGFSQKMKLELPGVAKGFLPTPGKKYPNGTPEWSLPTPYSLAIGYNMLATSIQMVRAYAVLANGGYLVDPTLIRKIIKEGKVLLDQTECKEFPKVLDTNITQTVIQAMKYTTKLGGTGKLADLYGYTEAGKSGTAEKIENGVYSREKYISSFIGIAPANSDPTIKTRFILLVSIEEPAPICLAGGGRNYHGGRCAAPVFQKIGRRTLEYLGVTPDDPHGYPPGDPRFDPDRADWLEEVRGLKHLYEEWNK